MKRTDIILAIARKELKDRLRNRWILIVSSLLVVSALIISYFGALPVGLAGFQRSEMTLVSLINLSIVLVPLLALILGSFLIIEERENGTLDLILSFPLTTGQYLAGTFLGLTLALGASILLGFGVSGAVLLAQGGIVTLSQYLLFLFLTFVLGVIFLAIAYQISILAGEKGKALAVTLFTWLLLVFLFDILLVGILVVSDGKISSELFGILLMLNPVDVFRILTFTLVEGAGTSIGLTGLALPGSFSPVFLSFVLGAWAAGLLALIRWTFHRRIGSNCPAACNRESLAEGQKSSKEKKA